MRKIGALVFPGFEVLDLFGPIEMFGMLPEQFDIQIVAESGASVASTQGPAALVDNKFNDAQDYDLLLVPGGSGTRAAVDNQPLLDWIRRSSEAAEIVMSVCTGSALLAKAGVLDGKRATSNKMAFDWVCSQSSDVEWVAQARWVEDKNVFTSSGVSAGMDMSLAVISRLCGVDAAKQAAVGAEYEWHDNPDWDPFAESHGLV